ncbi:hypothetical protein BGX20_009858, partial [Mortierella sp. AD010]
MERAILELMETCDTRIESVHREYNNKTQEIVDTLQQRVNHRHQTFVRLQKEYQARGKKRNVSVAQIEQAIEFVEDQKNTDFERMKTDAQRSMDRASSRRDRSLREIE